MINSLMNDVHAANKTDVKNKVTIIKNMDITTF